MSYRKNTPKGGMSSGNSGPAIMMMPPHIRATFMPNPPLKFFPPPKRIDRHNPRKNHPPPSSEKEESSLIKVPPLSNVTGLAHIMTQFERTSKPPKRIIEPTPSSVQTSRSKKKSQKHCDNLKPLVETYRQGQKASSGELNGMNCYNTLFVGRLAYEVTERKLLREMETFGPVKDLKLVSDKNKKSRGYAFVEYEHEEDMKRAYRAADAMRIEGREIVVDVERGHTVSNWLPRRLGGGLGGTRLGGDAVNVKAPGRFDPSKKDAAVPQNNPPQNFRGGAPPYGGGQGFHGPPMGGGGHHHAPHPMDQRYGGPPQHGGHPMNQRYGGPPMGGGGGGGHDRFGGGRGPPPPHMMDQRYGGRGDGRRDDFRGGPPPPNKRFRTGSPERRRW